MWRWIGVGFNNSLRPPNHESDGHAHDEQQHRDRHLCAWKPIISFALYNGPDRCGGNSIVSVPALIRQSHQTQDGGSLFMLDPRHFG
jgi:hypothetical protein